MSGTYRIQFAHYFLNFPSEHFCTPFSHVRYIASALWERWCLEWIPTFREMPLYPLNFVCHNELEWSEIKTAFKSSPKYRSVWGQPMATSSFDLTLGWLLWYKTNWDLPTWILGHDPVQETFWLKNDTLSRRNHQNSPNFRIINQILNKNCQQSFAEVDFCVEQVETASWHVPVFGINK